MEMVRVGQALKLEAIVRGLAPTSLATAGPLKPRPWEPRCIYPDFSHEVVCGDVWLDNKLILATENGTFLIEGQSTLLNHLTHLLIFLSNRKLWELTLRTCKLFLANCERDNCKTVRWISYFRQPIAQINLRRVRADQTVGRSRTTRDIVVSYR